MIGEYDVKHLARMSKKGIANPVTQFGRMFILFWEKYGLTK